MKLIVGLGNPGRRYRRTPHNAGFEVADLLALRWRGAWRFEARVDAEVAELDVAGVRTVLLKPLTYMNLSGHSVAAYARRNGTEPGEMLLISDDIHLPLGRLRIRPSGSHGGHKGLLSVINAVGSLDFPRLRIGVKPEGMEIDDWVEFVLKPLPPADREILDAALQDAADAVEAILLKGLQPAMNRFNRGRTMEAEE